MANRCANFDKCGHVVDNPKLKGEYCSLQCRAESLKRTPAVENRVTKPAVTGVVTKSQGKD